MLEAIANAVGSLVGAGVDLWEGGKNRKMQEEFAQNGIRWRVADAQAAGVHPLYALGANTVSYQPVTTGAGSNLAQMGQDVSRAIHATRTEGERAQALNDTANQLRVENMGLQNELLAAQIAKLKAAQNPPMPGALGSVVTTPDGKKVIVDKDRDKHIRLPIFGDVKLFEGAAAQDAEDKIGEASDWLYGTHYGLMALGQAVDRLVKNYGAMGPAVRKAARRWQYTR